MKKIINILKILIIIYLFILLLVKTFIISQQKLYENEFPKIKGYSFLKVNSDNLMPQIKENDYVLLKEEKEYKVNDNIYYNGKKFGKIKSIENIEEMVIITLENSNDKIVPDQIYAKAIYYSKPLSIILNIFTNPVVILALIIFVITSTSYTYKRYE